LIELLVICAILAVMVSIGIGSIASGQGAARVKGATRDIYAAIRHARSVALVTGQPAVVTYSTAEEDGEVVAKIEVMTAKLLDSQVDRSKMVTLSGEPVKGQEDEGLELVHIEKSKAKPFSKKAAGGDTAVDSESGGETVEDVLFAPMNTDIVKGMRLKVLKGDEELEQSPNVQKSKISVFSNVDYLLGKLADKKKAEQASAKKEEETTVKSEEQEPVSIVWETNGRVEPHKVWVYPDGKRPEEGLMLMVDRFGAVKVLSGDGTDERD